MDSHLSRREFLSAATCFAAGTVAGARSSELLAAASSISPPLPKRVLGKTGVSVSILGLGADGIVTDSAKPDEVTAFLQEALNSGIAFFDTAYAYGKDGRSEKNLGLLMGTKRRREAFLATKTGSRTYDGAMRQVNESLKRLRTDYLDLIQIHHLNAKDDAKALGHKDGALAALRKLRDQKVVRFIGLTGHPQDPQVKEALSLYEWDTFMGFVNPARFSEPALQEQIPLALKKGAGVIAMKTFGGRPGSLVGTSAGQADGAALLRFAWSQPIAVAIPGVTSISQFRQNLAEASRFKPMTAEEIKALTTQINSSPKPWQR
jgi:uncharacterized protein